MQLPKHAIEEYRKIYKQSKGEDLSYEEACLMAKELIELYEAVYLPVEKPNQRRDREVDL